MRVYGHLLICATPIGNLKDITLRVLDVLKEVDIIAAEDTRVTRKLLSTYDIKTSMVSYYEHNVAKRLPELIDRMKDGQNIALVTDSGVPGISDPGFRVITACIEQEIEVEIIPGPSAFISALVVSGLPTDKFFFGGFLPRKEGLRKRGLDQAKHYKATLVFYESPHRIAKTLVNIKEVLGDRRMVLARELTKKYEEVRRGTVSEVIESIDNKRIKGEIVLVVEGATEKRADIDDESIESCLLELIDSGLSKKEAVHSATKSLGLSKRRVFDIAKDL